MTGAEHHWIHGVFDVFVALHITTGAPGLLMFWAPVFLRKGSSAHVLWGRRFTVAMLATATSAAIMASLTLSAPMATHPQLIGHPEFGNPEAVRAIFGWMMLYLAILTINLAWYGWRAVRSKRDHRKNMEPMNAALQGVLLGASIVCFGHGLFAGQPMMMGISIVGFATVGTNLAFLLKAAPGPVDWLREHVKAHVGTGISVYTAFFAFGAVRLAPELALTPALWAAPLVVGLGLILWHWRKLSRPARRRAATA